MCSSDLFVTVEFDLDLSCAVASVADGGLGPEGLFEALLDGLISQVKGGVSLLLFFF